MTSVNPHDLTPHDLARPDATIRYWTGGAADARTLVLLHGATLDHQAWAPQADALQDRFRLVIPDLRAHGASTGSFDFEAAVQDVFALLDELQDEEVVLVGLSLGGNIAQEVVLRAADRVSAIVVADATCNTGARYPLATTMTVAALNSHAMLPGDHFGIPAYLRSGRGARPGTSPSQPGRENGSPSAWRYLGGGKRGAAVGRGTVATTSTLVPRGDGLSERAPGHSFVERCLLGP